MVWANVESTKEKSFGAAPVALNTSPARYADGDRQEEADGERRERAARELALPLDHRDAEARDRPELGPHDHGPDDQDRRVEQQPDGGNQRGQHDEGEVRARELGLLGGPGLDLLPDDRVGRAAARRALGLLRSLGERRVDRLERDRALLLEPQLAQVADDHAGILARDVRHDHVSPRLLGGTLKEQHIAH